MPMMSRMVKGRLDPLSQLDRCRVTRGREKLDKQNVQIVALSLLACDPRK